MSPLHHLIPTFDPSPIGLQRLYARLLLAMLLPLTLLHGLMLLPGATTPLAVLFEAAVVVLAWRLLTRAGVGIGGRMGRPAPIGLVISGIGALNIATAFETGGVASPQIVLVVLTVAFAGLLLEARILRRTVIALGVLYAFFTFALPDGLTVFALEGRRLGDLLAWRRLPVTDLTALVQNAVYLGLAAYVTHGAKLGLHRQWSSMQQRARRDPLTQLPNRQGFSEDVEKALAHESAIEWPMAVLMVDLDHFKLVNDRYGHATGDVVLRHAARLLRETVGPMDKVGRLGGEEFAVAAMAADPQHGADLAGRIVRRFRSYAWSTVHADLQVTCSVGVASIAPEEGRRDPSGALTRSLDQADQALYTVKANGRDGYHLAVPVPPPVPPAAGGPARPASGAASSTPSPLINPLANR